MRLISLTIGGKSSSIDSTGGEPVADDEGADRRIDVL